ncbi:hypothetical protein EI94DRAFT_1704259 [Lactarius quietus]|nr:hypothetical protein EI94DRAFT_1704259 [Lactarius quietus]
MGSALKWFKYETGAHRPEKATGAAVWVATRQPPPKPRMVDMSLKAAEFDAMLAQRQAQTEDTNHDTTSPALDTSQSTPAINTPGATQELYGPLSRGAEPGNIDPILLEEHHAQLRNNAGDAGAASSESDEDNDRDSMDNNLNEDDEDDGSNYEDDREYQDLRQRLAMTKRLNAESVQELALFSKADRKSREIRAFALALEIRDHLSHVEKNWTPSEDALTNIKAFCIACLLSTASSSYKFGVTGIVMVRAKSCCCGMWPIRKAQDMLKKATIGLPEGWYNDAAKQGAVSSAVTKYLTWMQADMKKLIRTSVKGPKDRPEDTQNVTQLADAIVGLGGPNTCATPLHWARFAVMCSVYLKSDGPQFWDKVDKKLKLIRETASSRYPDDILKAKKEIHTALNDIVQVDFEMWGNPMDSGRFATHDGVSSSNLIQRAIDNVATARAGDLGDLSMLRKANGQAHRKRHCVSRTQ